MRASGFNDSTKATREVIVNNYRIIYEIRGEMVFVLGVLHGARLYRERE